MTLPKIKIKKIDKEKFIQTAKKVQASFEEEARFLLEKRLKHGDNVSTHTYIIS